MSKIVSYHAPVHNTPDYIWGHVLGRMGIGHRLWLHPGGVRSAREVTGSLVH